MESSKMENCRPRINAKTRSWQMGNHSDSRAQVICPVPRRPVEVSFIMDDRVTQVPESIMPVCRKDAILELLDSILSKDYPEGADLDDKSNTVNYFYGSPPVRTGNPIIHDAQFAKQKVSVASPTSLGIPLARVGGSSPSCGSAFASKPKVRVEGFATAKSESNCVVPAFA